MQLQAVARAQSEKTEWIDDTKQYEEANSRPIHVGDRRLDAASLRQRHARLQEQQAQLQRRLDDTEVWGKETESYASLLEKRLDVFYTQYLPTGAAHPNARRAVIHFGGNMAALNTALKGKYGADLDDACRNDWTPESEARKAARAEEEADSLRRRPGTICQVSPLRVYVCLLRARACAFVWCVFSCACVRAGFNSGMFQCVADFVDAPASPFAAIGVKSKDFSTKKLHCGPGGACEPIAEVGQTLWEIPGSALDGFAEGFRHAGCAVSEGPKMACDGAATVFRHQPPPPKTEGFV